MTDKQSACRDCQLARARQLVDNNKIVHVTIGKPFNVMINV